MASTLEGYLPFFVSRLNDGGMAAVVIESGAGNVQNWHYLSAMSHLGFDGPNASIYTQAEAAAYIHTRLERCLDIGDALMDTSVTVHDYVRDGSFDVTVQVYGDHDAMNSVPGLEPCTIPVYSGGTEPYGEITIMLAPDVAAAQDLPGLSRTLLLSEHQLKQQLRLTMTEPMLRRALTLHDVLAVALYRLHSGTAPRFLPPV